jgi:plasmid maintenance system antidote protein VapI
MHNADFTRRLEQLLEYYSLTASMLADRIGVQRSGISHLLSGRNKPSLDFIIKLIESFPDLDLYWLLIGNGSMLKQNNIVPHQSADITPAEKIQVEKLSGNDFPPDVPFPVDNLNKKIYPQNTAVVKIIVLYEDGSFESYHSR